MHDVALTHTFPSRGESSFDKSNSTTIIISTNGERCSRVKWAIEPLKVTETITITTKRNCHNEIITTNTDIFCSLSGDLKVSLSLVHVSVIRSRARVCVSAIAF